MNIMTANMTNDDSCTCYS